MLEIKNANINSGVELNRSAGVWGESEGYVCEEEELEEEEEEWKVWDGRVMIFNSVGWEGQDKG